MNTERKFGFAATALAAFLTTAAFAQEATDQSSDQMMQNQDAMPGDMTGGDMSGMEGMEGMMPMMEMMQKMMPMMEKMGPMMEACTEMMQAKTDQMEASDAEPQDG